MELTEDQLVTEESCIQAIAAGERRLILVSGGAGSGKTLLAVRLLLNAARTKRRTVLATHNRHLKAVLRRSMHETVPHSDAIVSGIFELRRSNTQFDLIVCDEGQRLIDDDIEQLLSRSPLVVVFYDWRQRLLRKERGTRDYFLSAARDREVVELELQGNHRSGGGAPYERWVRRLLGPPERWSDSVPPSFENRFELRFFESADKMIATIRERRDSGHGVCLVASYTESDGRSEKRRLTQPKVEWAMDEEYFDFWANGANDIALCASVYGAQSFERDYVGIIWGRDLCIRNGRWVIPPDHTITDRTAAPTIPQLYFERGRNDEAIWLLFARYWIFFTRGKKGAFVFCEDTETREFIRGAFPSLMALIPNELAREG